MINVIEEKIKEVEDYIKEEEEEQWELDDHIYRSYHHSYKMLYARFNALRYLYITLYLIGKIEKIDWKSWDWNKMVKQCKKHIRAPKYIKFKKKVAKYLKKDGEMSKASLTYTIFTEMISNDLPKSKTWVPTTPHVIPYLGYFCFFKGILKCVLKWIKLGKLPIGFIDTWEGVSTYFIADINWTKKEYEQMKKYTEEMKKQGENNEKKN